MYILYIDLTMREWQLVQMRNFWCSHVHVAYQVSDIFLILPNRTHFLFCNVCYRESSHHVVVIRLRFFCIWESIAILCCVACWRAPVWVSSQHVVLEYQVTSHDLLQMYVHTVCTVFHALQVTTRLHSLLLVCKTTVILYITLHNISFFRGVLLCQEKSLALNGFCLKKRSMACCWSQLLSLLET